MRQTLPIWREVSLPDQPPFPGGTVHADVAVIGRGLAGLSAGYHLLRRQPGLNVVVLEARRSGSGASGHTTGLIGPGIGQSLTALVGRVGTAGAQALYRATLRAVEDVRDLILHEGL